jgi:carboxymethylenebutenolidase
MKPALLLAAIFVSAAAIFFKMRQTETKTCCGTSSTEAFAALGQQTVFQDAHPAPAPISNLENDGEMIQFPVPDAEKANAYFVKMPSTQFIFLYHEWWGLNDYIKNEADFWAKTLNVNVLCPDLYDGQVATDPETAGKLMSGNDRKRSAKIIEAAYLFAGEDAKVQSMGWCFGGGWSLQSALIGLEKTVGCVIYYGMPEENASLLTKLNCDVLGIFATKDAWINKDVVGKFEQNMRIANKKVSVNWFEADHAFANPSGKHYQEKEANAAREIVTLYLKSKL